MTMFTRSDKVSETGGGAKPPARDDTPAPAEAKRPQATAQPLSHTAPPPPPKAAASTVSVISKALKITGQLESTEDIQIDGMVDGDVRGVSVTVGGDAKIKGTVYGEEVKLSGTVDGKIEAQRVVLTSTAHMSGDVVHQNIKIEAGAFINGHCRPDFGKPESKALPPPHKPAAAPPEQKRDAVVGAP
ncbi:MAG: polymer-forming cytoskeletal protein [Alphaproteobacteria bacterium]|nr:polymer-forming cytoskeletal protein [Alphaproteobacteria bacterium]MDE2109859.1 polymer-forming cytoskeletal protein [Alphaproteobacteria bacterium]MDE2493543.1 polymer-forming cytoskeletal protein [Alphaproteobacteria bacterium]